MKRDIIVFDFETGGRNKLTCQPTQIAAIALDGRNFRPKGEFVSYMRPVTGQTRELLAKAPLPKAVWESFCEFVNRYNWKGTQFFAPIPCGYNIMGFDMPIVNRLCKQYNMYWDEANEQNKLFNKIYKIDVMDDMFLWTEGDPSIKSISMDANRERHNMSAENAHDALQDVKDTANLFIAYQKTRRQVYRNLKVEKTFAKGYFV
jgi:DNA polymerase III epsilon subunit-like protein